MIEYLLLALRSIYQNKLRSGMTLLGMVIGVWAITSMQGVVAGFDNAIQSELSALGSESFVVQKFPAVVVGHNWRKYARRKDLTYEDALYLQANAAYLRAANAEVHRRGQTIKYQGEKTSPTASVIGAMSEYMATASQDLAAGRFITPDDVLHGRQVTILGRDVADELFSFGNPLEQRVLIGGQGFQVIGLLDQATSTFDESADNVAIIPITTYKKVFTSGRRGMSSTALVLRAWDADHVEEAIDEVVALLRARRQVPLADENDFEVLTAESIMGTLVDFTLYIRLAAIGIAAISLLVAGIGIMNIMLVTVMERTREIGIRKAVGAHRRQVLMQFLIEAVILSEFGAVIGILVGVLTTVIISPMLEMEAQVPGWAMLSALGYCSVIGIFFGLYPARKASRLDPIDALRYE